MTSAFALIVIGLVEGFLSAPVLLTVFALLALPLFLIIMAFTPHKPLR